MSGRHQLGPHGLELRRHHHRLRNRPWRIAPLVDAIAATRAGDLDGTDAAIGVQHERAKIADVVRLDSADSRERVLLRQPQEHDMTEHKLRCPQSAADDPTGEHGDLSLQPDQFVLDSARLDLVR